MTHFNTSNMWLAMAVVLTAILATGCAPGSGGSNYYTPSVSATPDQGGGTTGGGTDGMTDPLPGSTNGLTAQQLYDRGDVFSGDMLSAVNGQRTAMDIAPILWEDRLSDAAVVQINDVISGHGGNLSHTGTDGSSVTERVARTGYPVNYATENLAKGYQSNYAVIEAWMNSPGHRANILDPNVTQMGAGLIQGDMPYWAQVFARPGVPAGTGADAGADDDAANKANLDEWEVPEADG